MTSTLVHAAPRAARSICLPATARRATLIIDAMPRRARASVEKLLLLLPESEEDGEVWFTRWQRRADGTYACREPLSAPPEALAEFARELETLAASWGFMAQLVTRPYHGLHG
ncbi:hypothetical protein M5J20_01145 [Corynebacterium sp. TA-R-1]|uniref:Uncharacterized protein n=1 Tax=Corynebacterium stercoris TaxID=2943490 RepID=A0ABT1G1H5_9CORY|nr:hypothetical protein [Corynebacterium stercoris]MCP1386808.1 hypothetical protein [Corynebacterium stercoris]